ncbi:unnamed protein product [Cylindrotheca closterium]|uniref:Phospholipid/glycerol acyltransferase domain-containing protein n=1 Tax=Cylindrotheca closterium TaxID=2856 RepID=A0AAD2G2X9_9STRA|nr:unnamed protein product [Cylindrotheca closterium]
MKLDIRALLVCVWCTATIEAFTQSSQHLYNPAAQQQQLVSRRQHIRTQNPNPFTDNEVATRVVNRALFSSVTSTDSTVFSLPSSITSSPMGRFKAALTKFGMMSFIASMCLALPLALFPPFALLKLRLINRIQKEQMALHAGQFCARWLMRLIPFASVKTIPYHDENPEPSIWVCNHVSSLDIFMLLATDLKLRGKNKRPMKIVYWKQLEDNPITKLLFQQSGFIPVQMSANKAGEANDYDMKSFKALLKSAKQAFDEGFDIGILPEGQLNPHPEEGLLPCFSGAFTLARMSKRPIHMMALHGTHRLWHAREDIDMTVTGRDVQVRCYPKGRKYKSGEEFLATFEAVVGEFGTNGRDLEDAELNAWLDGSKWEQIQAAKAEDEKKILEEQQKRKQTAKEEQLQMAQGRR